MSKLPIVDAEHAAAHDRDLDEARRLCYMALCAPQTDKYDLAGTLINALVHHQGSAAEDVVMSNVLAAIVDGDSKARGWLRAVINRISHELDD